ncbi:MAG TPA: Flp pilus assembly protein CpaB [Xanthobacteraceae bacterium]|nr:Flp pilus assembly protein CpaB [Xanthobacteraceae bacterium]
MRTSTFVMIGFAVLFGLLAVFLAQIWLNNQADERLKSIDAQRKAAPPARSIVVASKPLRFGDELTSAALREMPWPDNALPAGAFGKIADLTSGKRVVLMPLDTNEAVLASKITGPGQRATLSAMLSDGMKAVTIRVNDVEGVAGFVLPGDRVDILLTRAGEKNNAVNDVVIQDVRVLAVDQLADQKADKPSVVKAVTIEVDPTEGQKVALAATVGTLSLLLRKAGDAAAGDTRRVTIRDLMTAPAQESHFVTIGVMRPSRGERVEYTVPVEESDAHSAAIVNQQPARN